jgi:hypothetical protein
MIAAVAHDAGGAEIVSSYVRQHPGDWIFCLDGPARAIFERKLGAIVPVSLETAVQRGNWLLTGTGWQSDLEWRALRIARDLGKKAVAFLDHWTNYEMRFERGGVVCLPDEVWVGDRYAEDIARKAFGTVRVALVPNPYLIDAIGEIERASQRLPSTGDAPRILYVSEPIQEFVKQSKKPLGYDEFDALRFFCGNVDRVSQNVGRIVFRPHPAEAPGKYDSLLKEFALLPVTRSLSSSLQEDIAAADVVVGCETMALVVALGAGRRVISCVPEGGKPCSLPHSGIEHLTRLIGAR